MQVFFVDKLNNKLTSSHLSSICLLFVFYLFYNCLILSHNCKYCLIFPHMSLLLWRSRMALPYSRVLWPEPRPLPWKEYALTGFSIICVLIIIMIVLFCGGDCDIYLKCFLRMMNSPLRHRLSWWSLGELELRAPGFDDYLAFQHRSKFDPELRWVFLRFL